MPWFVVACSICGAPGVLYEFGWTTHRQAGAPNGCYHAGVAERMTVEQADALRAAEHARRAHAHEQARRAIAACDGSPV